MKILLTGASSYVAKYIARGLLSFNHQIIATSRTSPNIKTKNYRWIQHDLSEKPMELNDDEIDIVIHVAGSAWMNRTTIEYVNSNILTTINLEKMIHKLNPKTTFYISSRDIHGEIVDGFIDEETEIINPIIYGHTKYIAENILSENDNPTIIFRMPSIIGIGTHGWINSVFKKMKNNQDIIYTNSKFNNFIHASEISNVIMKFIKNYDYKSSTYVMGCSDLSTSEQILLQMKTLLKSNSKLTEIEQKNNSYTMKVDKLMRIYKTMTVHDTINTYIDELENDKKII